MLIRSHGQSDTVFVCAEGVAVSIVFCSATFCKAFGHCNIFRPGCGSGSGKPISYW
jgi:hypothetical protein